MKLLIIMLLIIVLTGCTTTETVYRDRWLAMEKQWLANCGIIPPPSVAVYTQATDAQRAVMMTQSYVAMLEETAKCNVRIKEARDHNDRMILKTKVDEKK